MRRVRRSSLGNLCSTSTGTRSICSRPTSATAPRPPRPLRSRRRRDARPLPDFRAGAQIPPAPLWWACASNPTPARPSRPGTPAGRSSRPPTRASPSAGRSLTPFVPSVARTRPSSPSAPSPPCNWPVRYNRRSSARSTVATVASVASGRWPGLALPFELVPLYGKVRARGFTSQTTQLDDGTLRIEFTCGEASTSPGKVACRRGHD